MKILKSTTKQFSDCDGRCHRGSPNRRGKCTCICRGKFHGARPQNADELQRELAEVKRGGNGNVLVLRVSKNEFEVANQKDLFEVESEVG